MFTKLSVKRPYTVVVVVVLVLILGFVSFDTMTVDLFPNMNLPYALVMTTYQGASPEEVETVVTRPIEQVMATVSNIRNVSSRSRENSSIVILEFEQITNMDSVTIEMREGLDQLSSYWPDTIGNPMIIKLNPNMMPIMIPAVSVAGMDAIEATRVIETEVVPEIESVEGVASVSISGDVRETIRITIKEARVSNVDASIRSQLEQKTKEAEDALNQARAQVEDGKNQLEAGKNQAKDQMAQAELELAKGDAELTQGLLEISARLSEVNLAQSTMDLIQAPLDSSEQSLLEQKEQLEALYARKDQIEQEYQAVLDAIQEIIDQGGTPSQELLLAQTTLAAQLAILQSYDATMTQIIAGLEQIAAGRQTVDDKRAELEAAEAMLNQVKTQLEAGALTLAQARSQLTSAQIEGLLQMSSANTRLALGEAQIQASEAELKTRMEEIKKAANVSSMMTATMISGILAAQNFNMPAGYVNEHGIDYLVRVGEKFDSLSDLKNLILVDMEGIKPIRLSDIADVERIDNAQETYSKLNGEHGILFQIQKQTGYSTGDVTDRILKRFEEIQKANRDIKVVVLMDQGIYIKMIIDSVLENLIFGAILSILILLLFLKDLRPTFVIATSIPISILAAIVLMYFSGITLNIISLSGLALGVGMLVDNSIVVIENIFRMRTEEGASAKEAAIHGATQVAGAITASTLTTVCVFLPIVFTQGLARQLFVDMGLTIAYSLVTSLVVALTLVPMMSAGLLRKTKPKESKLFQKILVVYEKLLRVAMKGRIFVLLGALALFVITGWVQYNKGIEFMPSMESSEISMAITFPEGTAMEEMQAAADQFGRQLQEMEDIGAIGAMANASSFAGLMGMGGKRSNRVEFYALVNENRTISDAQLQSKIEAIAAADNLELSLTMSNMDMSALGASGISIQIKGRDLDTLQQIAKDVAGIVGQVSGTRNVSDGMERTTEELRVVVDKDKAIAHNLTVAQVYQSISGKLRAPRSVTSLDLEAASFDIMVTEQKNEELTRADVERLTIEATAKDGRTSQVPLKEIAAFETGFGLQSISRDGQSRYISVTAEVEDDNISLVSARIQTQLDKYDLPPGYTVEMAGEDQSIRDMMTELYKMLALALVFMYLIMVAQFQSLRSPFIVMFTIPLAFTGGFIGLMIAGSPISIIAMIGFIMLSGVIVNNGIVFIDYANQLRNNGIEMNESLIEAGKTRMRPIIMTALTTILGLLTMAMGLGSGAAMIQPMAIVTIGGLLYGTILTLFVVPCIYSLFKTRERTRLKEGIEGGIRND